MALRWIGVADLERVRAWDDGDGGRATGTEMSAECGGAGAGLGSVPPRRTASAAPQVLAHVLLQNGCGASAGNLQPLTLQDPLTVPPDRKSAEHILVQK